MVSNIDSKVADTYIRAEELQRTYVEKIGTIMQAITETKDMIQALESRVSATGARQDEVSDPQITEFMRDTIAKLEEDQVQVNHIE